MNSIETTNWIYLGQLIVMCATLYVTYSFYSRLVDNDTDRLNQSKIDAQEARKRRAANQVTELMKSGISYAEFRKAFTKLVMQNEDLEQFLLEQYDLNRKGAHDAYSDSTEKLLIWLAEEDVRKWVTPDLFLERSNIDRNRHDHE
jgi:hypothetical protein